MYFKNKVVWVTGASSGIGRATAIAFSKQGAKLIISGRHANNLLDTKNACADPLIVHIIPFDLADYLNFKPIAAAAIAVYGHIDILVNNGGISQRSLVEKTGIKVDEKIMKVNYLGTVALTKALLPHFIERKAGNFVIVSSVMGKIGTPLRSSYAASKHALHGFFDSLRAEIHKYNINVNLICPGYVQTNVSMNALTGDGKPQNKMDTTIQNGIKPEKLAKGLLKAVRKNKNEVSIGNKEIYAVLIKRFFPKIVARVVRKIAFT